MSDCIQQVPTYESMFRRAVAKPSVESDESYGKDLIVNMYDKVLDSIRAATAIYKQIDSRHKPLVEGSTRTKVHACFSTRPGILPPRETWMANVSQFKPDDSEQVYVVIDRLDILLPTNFSNLGQQIDLAVYAFSYLKQEFNVPSLLFPTLALQKKDADTNLAISKYGIKKVARGTTEIVTGPKTSQLFFKL